MNHSKKPKMYDWHRLLVQAVMSRGYMPGEEVFELAKAMQKNETFRGKNEFRRVNLESDNAKADMADFIEDLLDTANSSLEPIHMQIKKGADEFKTAKGDIEIYKQYYTLVLTEENEAIAKLQKHYSEPELEWLKLVCEYLIDETEDRVETDTKLINLCLRGGQNASKKKLSTMETQKVLLMFLADGYLIRAGISKRANKGGRIGLGTRLLLELDTWLLTTTNIDKCSACQKVVAIYTKCSDSDCEGIFHASCLEKRGYKCSVCRHPVKLVGSASKRS